MNINQMNRRKEMAKRIRPLLVLLILVPVVTFMMYPMVNMSPRDLHVGIVSLDNGAQFDQGNVNLGDKIIKNITNPEDDSPVATDGESPVVWEIYDTEADAKAAMKDKNIYAYLLIPKDFSKKQTQQLDAFNNLSTALGKMSEGTGKMSAGIGQASGKLTQLPEAFKNLARASDNLGKAAKGGQAILSVSSNSINENADAIKNNDAAVNSQISGVQSQLNALEKKVESGTATTEEIQLDIETIQQSLAGVSADNTQLVNDIKGATGPLTGEGRSAAAIFQNIAKAQAGMSSNFNTMAGKMSDVKNITQLGTALGTMSTGLSQMSEGMDEKVSDAIDTMNGDSSSEGAETVKLKFYIDQSRNVMVSSTLAQMINGISAGSGMQVDTHYVNKIPDELNNFFFAMVFMMMVMFSSMIPGILTGFTIKPQGSRIARAKTIALQIILAVAIAACLGFAIPRIVAWMGGYDLPIGQLTLFVGICSFGILMIAIGAMDLLGKPGVAAPLIIMFCGTAVANLPYEYLPEFWQKFVYPWEPLRFIAEGVREIIYRGGDGWNQFSSNMMWVVVIGLAFMLISLLKRRNGGLEEE